MIKTDKDLRDATVALLHWIDSQNFFPSEAGMVLAEALVAIIRTSAEFSGKEAAEGGVLLTGIIMEKLRED